MKPPLTTATEATTVPFTLRANLIVVEVVVNGEAAGFLLDTGASTSLIGRTLADRIGLEDVERSAAMGAGGAVDVSVARLDSLAVGELTDSDIACTIMDLAGVMRQLGEEVEGVLGFDFFGHGTLEVNYPARTVRIERPVRAKGPAAVIEGRTATLPEWELALSWPEGGWTGTTKTPLPSMPLLVTGPGNAELSVTSIAAVGLSPDSARGSLELSVPAQVHGFLSIASGWVERPHGRAFRMEYTGVDDDGRAILGWTEALLRDQGLLVLTARAPREAGPEIIDAIESILRGVADTRAG